MKTITDIYHGDSKGQLGLLTDNFVDLIVTSPPDAEQRKDTYGGIRPAMVRTVLKSTIKRLASAGRI